MRVDRDVGAGRDRVLDLTKSFALLVVVVAHALAWDVSTGTPASILDLRPELAWVTWLLQVLPLFFAAGAVSNLASWSRTRDARRFWRRRVSRLSTPAVLYALVWASVLLPLALLVEPVEMVGRYLAQLLWFLGVYGAAVVAVPLTARWASRPVVTLAVWLGVIVAVDLVRWQVAPLLGWFNMLLVWAWLHQLGYSLPALRARAHRDAGDRRACGVRAGRGRGSARALLDVDGVDRGRPPAVEPVPADRRAGPVRPGPGAAARRALAGVAPTDAVAPGVGGCRRVRLARQWTSTSGTSRWSAW